MRPWLWVVAGRVHRDVVVAAKHRGYGISLLYVGLQSASLARQRVEDQVSKGGHDVPAQDIVRRYARTLAHLPEAIVQSDVASVCDNSGSEPIRLLRVAQTQVTQLHPAPPNWFTSAISDRSVRIGEMIHRRE